MDEAMLLAGGYLVTDNKIKVKHPTIREVVEFGEFDYFNTINLFTLKPYDLMVQLDDMGIDYVDLSNYDLFILLYQSSNNKHGLNWLLDYDYDFKLYKDNSTGLYLLYDKSTNKSIDIVVYSQISDYIKKVNMISNKTTFNPANKRARKFIIDNERRKQKRLQKRLNQTESQITNLVSALVWGNTSGINYSNIWDLYIYQFFDGVSRLQKIKEYTNIMQGYYAGTIDLKNINTEEVNWLTKINL